MRKNIKSLYKKVKNKLSPPFEDSRLDYVSYSFSQCGEDRIIQHIFELKGIFKPTYMDIGANLPWHFNNTALFYHTGCRGISIEPNPMLYKKLMEERPEDTNLNIGVSSSEDTLDFHILSDPTLSTFSSKELENFLKNGFKLIDTIKIPVMKVSILLDKYFSGRCPDIMSIDVEGMELEILKSFDLKNNGPKVLCVETAEYSSTGKGEKRSELMYFITQQDYFLYADTNINSIYVQQSFWNKL